MSVTTIISLITGSAGALVVLTIGVWALVRGWVYPGPVYDAASKRIELLEAENSDLSGDVTTLRSEGAAREVKLARVEERMVYLERELNRIKDG